MTLPTTLVDTLAQWQPGPHGPGPHGPHWGAGAGMGGAGLGAGGWWLVLLLTLLLVVAAALYMATRKTGGRSDGALDALRERYATGDIDEEEFERRRERLTRGTG